VKKNRRGLGRGLGALIQSTVPEDESSETAVPSDSDTQSTHTEEVKADEAASLSVDIATTEGLTPTAGAQQTSGVGAQTVSEVDEAAAAGAPSSADVENIVEKPEKPGKRDAGSGVTVAQESEHHIADRYLDNGRPSDGERTVPRETRRPVDLFFPDRRSESATDASEKTQPGRTPPPSNGRKRPTMPALTPPTPRSPKASTKHDVEDERNQPEEVESPVSPTPSAGATEAASDATGPEARFFGAAGNAELRSIPVADIHPNPRQPREVFDEDDMDELVASITEVGVLQPIVVRPVDGPSPYELVMGERRWRATQRAGLTTVPAIVRHTADTALLRDALLENLHRSQLNPLEEAAAYEQLLEDFDCTQDELSSRIGRSRPQISNTLRLLKLPPLVQRRVASGVLSAGHARALLGLVDPAEMEKLAQKIVSEGLSVRATEELVSLHDGIRQAKPKSRGPRTERHERLDYLANSLTDQLDTTVKITLGARKGKIAIDFASVEDLNRIMTLINPSGSTSPQP
jgi:ParB family transcriptional regulator, chromosome partitioning protein